MSETRIVSILMNSVEQSTMIEATDRKEWERAIDYLSTWNMTHPRVSIIRENDTDMVAVYRDDQNNRKYVIGAVWHGDHYGFHS